MKAYALTYAIGVEVTMTVERHVKVFKNGRNRAVRIPVEFEFAGDEVIMRKEGDRIIMEPIERSKNLLALLQSLEPIDDDFDFDEKGPLPKEFDL